MVAAIGRNLAVAVTTAVTTAVITAVMATAVVIVLTMAATEIEIDHPRLRGL